MRKLNRHNQRREKVMGAIDLRQVNALQEQQKIHAINRLYEMGANLFLNLCLEEFKGGQVDGKSDDRTITIERSKELSIVAAKAAINYNDSFADVMREYQERIKQEKERKVNESGIIEG